MSNVALEKLRSEALRLSEKERAELAQDLMKSLDAPADPNAADAWDQEIARRLDEIDAGTAKLIDRAELRRRMQERLIRPLLTNLCVQQFGEPLSGELQRLDPETALPGRLPQIIGSLHMQPRLCRSTEGCRQT